MADLMMRCPKCNDENYLDITATVRVRLVQDEDGGLESDADQSEDGSHEWGEWTGIVADLKKQDVEITPTFARKLAAVLELRFPWIGKDVDVGNVLQQVVDLHEEMSRAGRRYNR